MLTQARGRTGVALLLFILVGALAADHLAALPPARGGGEAALREPPGVAQADRPPPGARGAHATRSITP